MIETPKKISILLASDFSILSDSLTSIFKGTKDLKLVGCANSTEELTVQIEKFPAAGAARGYLSNER